MHVPAARQPYIDSMLRDHAAACRQIVHRLTEQPCVCNDVAVIREDPHAGRPEFVEMRQLLADAALGDCSDRQHLNQPDLCAPGRDKPGYMTRVCGGIGVRHREDGGVSPGRRGSRAGLDIFLPLLARLTEVGMEIDEPRPNPGSFAVDRVAALEVGADLSDEPVTNPDVGLVETFRRKNGSPGKDQITHCSHLRAVGTTRPFAQRLR